MLMHMSKLQVYVDCCFITKTYRGNCAFSQFLFFNLSISQYLPFDFLNFYDILSMCCFTMFVFVILIQLDLLTANNNPSDLFYLYVYSIIVSVPIYTFYDVIAILLSGLRML